MIKPDKIQLHCSNCDPSDWILFDRDEVRIDVDLKTDEYRFYAVCPECGEFIENSRKAF